jgi:hypothetical protein
MSKHKARHDRWHHFLLRAGVALVIAAGMTLAGAAYAALSVPELAEDDPGWSCNTMGDHRCGPWGYVHPDPVKL